MLSRKRNPVLATLAAVSLLGLMVSGVATGGLKEKSTSFNVPGGTFEEGTAKCKHGREAVAGGFLAANEDVIPRDFVREGKRQWRLRSNNLNSSDPGTEATVQVLCAKPRFGLKEKSVTDSVVSLFDSLSVRCQQGREAVAGGFEIPGGLGPIVTASRRTSKREWTVGFITEGPPTEVSVSVYCDQRERSLKEKAVTETLPSGGNETVTASCSRRQRVVSGGFQGETADSPLMLARTFGSRRTGKRDWTVTGHGNVGVPEITAYAYCERKGKKK
jgi:hypothetical protein